MKLLLRRRNKSHTFSHRGRSVAVAAHFKGMSHYKLYPTVLATYDMTPVERYAYEPWLEENVILPPMAWETMKEKAFIGQNTKKRNDARVEAIHLLYCYPQVTGQYLAYMAKHREHTVSPLIKVTLRAESMKKDPRGGQDIDIEGWAEFQCV